MLDVELRLYFLRKRKPSVIFVVLSAWSSPINVILRKTDKASGGMCRWRVERSLGDEYFMDFQR